MTHRAFVISLIGIAAMLLGGTMVLNVATDPEAVFDPSLEGRRINANSRYLRFIEYHARPVLPDAVLFASSRGNVFDRDVLARRMNVESVANFSVNFGMVTDHLPTLEYLLRDLALRGGRLRAVLLMLDVDHFGKMPWTNINLDGFLPPEISGEHKARFWWRYLTAFQFRVWSATIRKNSKRPAGTPTSTSSPGIPAHGAVARAAFFPRLPLQAAPVVWPVADNERRNNVLRSQLSVHLELLAKIVRLCDEHDVRLIVVTSPLSQVNSANHDQRELTQLAERLSRVVPLWDFSAPSWLSERPDLWLDPSHFGPSVGTMMLDRVFGPAPSAPTPFGVFRRGS
jgi:hypothetical protein